MLSFLEYRDAPVSGIAATTTYRQLRDTFDVIIGCGYFCRPLSTTAVAVGRDTNETPQTIGHDLHGLWNVL